MRALARELRSVHAPLAGQLDREAERIEASAVDFAQMRAAHLVASGAVNVSDGERRELERLLLGNGSPQPSGSTPAPGPTPCVREALRRRQSLADPGVDPLADPRLVEVGETAARTSESLYAAAVG